MLRYQDVSIASIVLRRIGSTWRIATHARLGLFAPCIVGVNINAGPQAQGAPAAHGRSCPQKQRRLSFAVGQLTPVSGSLGNEGSSIPIPAAVQRAGGQELHEFIAGGATLEQTGCEACHRLAGEGNDGPGPALDNIGSRLSKRQLVSALDDPRAPMPSYRNLPAGKFKALVEFLTLLR